MVRRVVVSPSPLSLVEGGQVIDPTRPGYVAAGQKGLNVGVGAANLVWLTPLFRAHGGGADGVCV